MILQMLIRPSEEEQLLIRPLLRETKNTNMAGG
jgi:hypothetical protein